MWSKLVRLNALACTTSAFDRLLGEIRSTPELRAELVGAIEEGCAVARAEGASTRRRRRARRAQRAHATLGSSMQRDIAAGRAPELDAIPGAVLRAAARHGLECPTIERLVGMIAARAGVSRRGRGRGAERSRQASRAGAVRDARRPVRARAEGRQARHRERLGGDRLDDLLLALASALVVLAVAQHAEVAAVAAVGVDRDARQDLLALLEAQRSMSKCARPIP